MRDRIKYFILLVTIFLMASCGSAAKTITAQKYVSMGRFKLTAFCPCYECSKNFSYNTASGEIAKEKRTIAVDPDVISYGSQVLIGNDIYVAEDCGGGVNGDHIDIFFDSHEGVKDFGVRYRDVYVIRGSK